MFTAIGCQKKTCKDFHTGTFKSPDESVSDIIISRYDSVQVEESEQLGIEDIYSIYWLSDCEYYLVLKQSNNPQNNLLTYQDTLRVTISAIEENTYQYTALQKGEQFVGDLKQISENTD